MSVYGAFVTVRGKKYYLRNDKLDLRLKKIRDISEIEGLDTLTTLKVLILDHNRIKEIKGLENLINLQILDLSYNEITEIKGLEQLIDLIKLDLKGNPIKEEEAYLVDRSADEVVSYCRERILEGLPPKILSLVKNQGFFVFDDLPFFLAKFVTKQRIADMLKSLHNDGKITGIFNYKDCHFISFEHVETVEKYILDKAQIYSKISFEDVASKFKVPMKAIEEIVEGMLRSKKLDGSIDAVSKSVVIKGREIVKREDLPIEVSASVIRQLPNVISIKRGYETAGQYVKVGIKVENLSETSITDVKVILDMPSGLEPVNPTSGIIELGIIRPQGSQGANFQLRPIRCVNDVIHATIVYRDVTGKALTEDMEALNVRNICPMLTDEGVDKEHILMSLRKGDISKNRSSFKFRGDLKTAFIMAESRVRGLIQLDRDERFINDQYIASGCYIGRTKYGKFDFATEITVCGKENEGLLTISVYSDEEAILSGFFYEVLEDVRKSVEILEERVKVVKETCPECGGLLPKDTSDIEGYIRCSLCETLFRLPSWERGKES